MTTDPELRNAVQAELDWDPRFDARDISVAVKQGTVELHGSVASLAQRAAVEDAATHVAGVVAIASELEVVPAESARRTDAEIAVDVAAALRRDSQLPASSIRAIVRHGCLTLEGDVAYRYQMEAALHAVQHLPGLKSIVNDVRIKPLAQTQMEAVKLQIDAALQRRARIDSKAICVTCDSSVVHLAGEVSSLRERSDAEEAAWKALGITSVENRIRVVP